MSIRRFYSRDVDFKCLKSIRYGVFVCALQSWHPYRYTLDVNKLRLKWLEVNSVIN